MSLKSIRPKAALEAALWLLLLGFVGSRMWPQIAAAFGVDSASQRAPEFHLTTLAGEPVSREALRGKVVLVNFWATWCPPCRLEMPGFQKIYDRKHDQGFTILGVATDAASTAEESSFLRERGITYPVAMANGEAVSAFGNVNTLPTSFLIDRDGRIRYEVRGIFAAVSLEQAVDRLLAEPAVAMAR